MGMKRKSFKFLETVLKKAGKRAKALAQERSKQDHGR